MSWIKMRTNLASDPRVMMLSQQLQVHRAQVIGGLFMLWAIADQHSEDGSLPGYTAAVVDEMVGIPGFSKALAAPWPGWLVILSDGVCIERFDEHNTASAKQRAQAAVRASRSRHADSVTEVQQARHAASVTETRSEKRREEKKHHQTDETAADADGKQISSTSRAQILAWAAQQAKRPEWLPEGKGWIDQASWAKLAECSPDITQADFDRVMRQARASARQLKNPAGYVLKKLAEAQRIGAEQRKTG